MGVSPKLRHNIELQGRAVDAVNAREVPRDILAPDFRMENRASAVTDYEYVGAAGWRDWMYDMLEEFTGNAHCDLEEIIAADDACVVAAFRIAGSSVRSGEPLTFHWIGVTWLRDGRAVRSAGFASRREALEAAGM